MGLPRALPWAWVETPRWGWRIAIDHGSGFSLASFFSVKHAGDKESAN
jgi:hypothetical protein